MQLPLISCIDVWVRNIFLRVDLDVPFSETGIADDTRLVASLETIEYLISHGATLVVGGHAGRPPHTFSISNFQLPIADENKMYSLAPVAQWYEKMLHIGNETLAVTKMGEFIGWKLSESLFLLENLRFFEGEEKNDSAFAQKLAALADIYVNDAFAVCHRDHASIIGIASLLPHYAGLHLGKEVEVLSSVLNEPKRPLVVVIGGAKIETKMPLIEKMGEIADFILVGGKLPMEEAVQKLSSEKIVIGKLTPDGTDITQESATQFREYIAKASMVVWNGPLGLVRGDAHHALGTKAVAQAIAESAAYKIVGGGDTIDCVKRL